MIDLLPPASTALERALSDATARLGDVEAPQRSLWDPKACPAFVLPWMAWGLSIDFWDASWTEAEKRAAIASAIDDQRRKGTPASVRAVVDRFDVAIAIVEWFDAEATPALDPYTFRLEIPLAAQTEVTYTPELIRDLLRDLDKVKPVRCHMEAVHRLKLQATGYLTGGAHAMTFGRLDMAADVDSALDPVWATYLQTEIGEPLQGASSEFLEAA